EHGEGPILVVAGAGTGKTRVITERVRWLLETRPQLAGENILAVTFTEKAAAEMKSRIVRATGTRGQGVWVSTFHAFCHRLLAQHAEPLDIFEDIDYWIFLRRRLNELGLDLFKKLSEPGAFLNDFCRFFSRCQDELVTPEDYAAYVAELRATLEKEQALLNEAECTERAEELRKQEEIARVYAASERLLRSHGRITFGGLLLRAVQLLEQNAEVRAHWQERVHYILVDEFQDTNIAQIELVALLAGQRQNVMAVGDDDQAIYRFRGASFGSFRRFSEKFPGHRTAFLEENYRSTGRILAVATELIRQNGLDRFQPDKSLRATRAVGEKVRVAELADKFQEATYVAQEIERLHNEHKIPYGRFAVLYRAHHHRNQLVRALARAGIPFVIRRLSILGNTLIRDLIAYLRALDAPHDSVSLARLLAIPHWGLVPAQVQELAGRARREHKPLYEIIQALHPSVLEEHTRLGGLLRLIEGLRAERTRLTVTELFEVLLERLELRLLAGDPDRAYLERFANFLAEWQQTKSQSERLDEFIEYLNYFLEGGGEITLPEGAEHQDAVQLMTVHAAKGLEFDQVFVLRMNRGAFPTTRRRPLFVFPERLMKEVLPRGDFHTEEERRLCYVALTRARDRLWLLTIGGRSRPSIFLEDILRDARVARNAAQLTPPLLPVPDEEEPVATEALFAASRAASRAYSQIADWVARAATPEPPLPLEISHSHVETYRKCPLKYKLTYIWKIPTTPTPALIFGQVMHRTLTEFFRQRRQRPDLPFTELEHIYDQEWRQNRHSLPDPYQEQEYRKAGREQLAAFYEQQRDAPMDVLHVEKSFRLPLDELEITGRIDQINRFGGRTVEIIEYKTGRARSAEEAEESLQLTLYAAAAARVLRLRAVRLVLYDLTSNQALATARTEEQQEKALETVAEIAAQIRAQEFPAQPGVHCRYCEFQSLCPVYEESFTVLGTPTAKLSSGEKVP
ncbi:MAG: UvrD-helicase domain-containing protein, partial [Acidobacteria bacterium]|nr:UvrD-helicase domain-containing protein [Acidobacteriota bacterium]